MPPHFARIPQVVQLASRVEQDIRSRQLRPGDAYLNTAEVAKMLGVNKAAANRTMQLLAKRQVVSRGRNRAVIVAEGIVSARRPPLRCVHFLVQKNYLRTEGLLVDGVLVGMQEELPDADVQLNFLPGENGADTVNQLIAAAVRSPDPEGFVLVRAPLAVQRAVQASGLPAVVHGTLFPSIHGISWVDRDHRQGARLLAEHLLRRGCRRVLHLQRDRILPGDYVFRDALREALAEVELPIWALTDRQLPADREAIKAEVAMLLGRGGDILPGIIAMSEPLADGAVEAAESLGLSLGRDIHVAAYNVYRSSGQKPPRYPHLRTAVDPIEIGVHLGRFLARQARRQPCDPNHEVIPVVLEEPQTQE